VITVDIRNNITVRGKLNTCESTMHLELSHVTWTDVTGRERRFDQFYIKGRQIVYIHIPDEVDIIKAMNWQLNKAEYFQGKQRDRMKNSYQKKFQRQEMNRNKLERRERSTSNQRGRGRGAQRFGEDRGRGGQRFGEDRGRGGQRFGEDSGRGGQRFGEDRRDAPSRHSGQFKTPLDKPGRSSTDQSRDISSGPPRVERQIKDSTSRSTHQQGEKTNREGFPQSHQDRERSASASGHSSKHHHQEKCSQPGVKKEFRSAESLLQDQGQGQPRASQSYWDNEEKAASEVSMKGDVCVGRSSVHQDNSHLRRPDRSASGRPVREERSSSGGSAQREDRYTKGGNFSGDRSVSSSSIKRELTSSETPAEQSSVRKSESYWDNQVKCADVDSQVKGDRFASGSHDRSSSRGRVRDDRGGGRGRREERLPSTSRIREDRSHSGGQQRDERGARDGRHSSTTQRERGERSGGGHVWKNRSNNNNNNNNDSASSIRERSSPETESKVVDLRQKLLNRKKK